MYKYTILHAFFSGEVILSVDQPRIENNMPAKAENTSNLAYVSLCMYFT
jgi:hypothetical protein